MRDSPSHGTPSWRLRPARPDDVEPVTELRAVVMRPDLERLGVFDEHRVRQRFRDAFRPEHTWIVESAGGFAGSVPIRPAADGHWLEHFYLATECQGRGLGSAVLRDLLARTDSRGLTVRLNVLRGSSARRLYERHGFTVDSDDGVDLFMVRPVGSFVAQGLSSPYPPRGVDPATT